MEKKEEKFSFKPKLTAKQTIAWDAIAQDTLKKVLYDAAGGITKVVEFFLLKAFKNGP